MPDSTLTAAPRCYFSPRLASQMLAGELGGTTAFWGARLQNQRRPERKAASAIPFTVDGDGKVRYEFQDLKRYVAEETARRVAISSGEAGDQPRAAAVANLDDGSGSHVRMMVSTGRVTQSAFALQPGMARELAAMLLKAADLVDRALGNDLDRCSTPPAAVGGSHHD